MKKLFILFFTFCFFLSFSQVREGSKVFDFNLAFSKSDLELFSFVPNGTVSSFQFEQQALSINPVLGFAVSENQILFFGPKYSYTKSISDSQRDEKTNLYSLVIGYEKLFDLADKLFFGPSLSGSVGFGKKELKNFDAEFLSDLTQIQLSISSTLYFFINNNWMLKGSIDLLQFNLEKEEVEIIDGDNLSLKSSTTKSDLGSNPFGIGVRYLLTN